MALNLLERVKNKALEALQGAGSFIQQDFQRSPIGQGIESFSALLQNRAPNPPPPPPIDFGSILKNVATTAGKVPLFDTIAPSIPGIAPLSPFIRGRIGGPTVGDAANVAADLTYRPVTRIGAEGVMTLTGDNREYDPATDFKNPDIAKFLYGSRPLQNYNDPDRPGRQFAKQLGNESLAPLLIGGGVALDAVPVNPAKILGKGGIKAAAKSAGSFDDFLKLLKGNKQLAQEATAIFKDAKNPINDVVALYGKYGPAAGKKTMDVIKEAKQVAPKVEEIVKGVDPFQPGNIYKKKGTTMKLIEDAFRSSKGVIERSGPAGKEIVRRLNASEEQASMFSGAAIAKMEAALKGLKGPEIDTFADVVEGSAKAVSDKQKAAVKVWKSIADDVFKKAKAAGLDVKERRNYFPHQVSDLTNADKKAFAAQMVASGKYRTEAEALQALEREIGGAISEGSQRRFGNLEFARDTDLPYNKSPNVLFDYIENAYGRIADTANFGKADEELYKLARAAGTQGGDSNQVVKYLDQILGKNQNPNKVTQALTSLQTITKLSPVTSAINLTQNLSTWLRTDTGAMAATMKNIVKNPKLAYENATKVGQITPSMAKDLQDFAGSGNAATKWIRLIGMQGTEKFNRVVAVNAGIEYGQKLARQAANGSGAALRELERFGITLKDVNKAGQLTDDALKKISREVSKTTQFSTKPGELPYFWRTNVGKVVTQFKSFAYKQTGFMADNAKRSLSEASKGNVKPLINTLVVMGIAAPIAGEIVNDFKALIRNKSREDTDSLTERYFSNIMAAVSFGLFDSTSGLLGEFGPQGAISTITGPTGGDALKVLNATEDIPEGDPYNRTLRNAVKTIPGVGQTIANTFIPNGYVDNLDFQGNNLGVNEGDKVNAPEEGGGGFLDMLNTRGKQTGGTISWTSEDGKKMSVDLAEKTTKGTGDPDDISKYKSDTSSVNKAIQIFGAPADQVSDEEKVEAFKKLGVEYDDVRYAYKADFTVDEKTQYIVDKNMEHEELLQSLATGRVESIGGTRFASDGVLDNLFEQGLISKEERAYLKKIKIGKDGKLSTSSLQGTGVSQSKIRSFINSVNSLYKDPITDFTPGKDSAPKAKIADQSRPLPKAPKLNLSTKGGSKKSSSQWFTAY